MQRFTNYCNMLPIKQDTGYNKLEQQIFMFKRQGYPMLHINMSELIIKGFDSELPILLRDHVIWCDNYIVGQQFNKQFGTIQIQDMGIALELQNQPIVELMSFMKIQVPEFTEDYIYKVT